uniref:E3 ubiquitin-protein ligase MBR1-like n=1 Tax=Erigeron canadensis TaxID=72917 RepID=UPI001CB8D4F2|nr:E3 ubiquitin-protein ligase MBR1-like [Erigeron canadensis]
MATEHGKQRKQRIKSHTATTSATQVISEPKQGFPCRKKLFGFLSLGCGRVSSPAMAVHLPEKSRRRKKKKKQRKSRESCPENVCCTPPSIGFAYDVALSTSVDAHRRNHRQRARSARHVMNVQQRPWSTTHVNEATFIRSNVPDSRQFNRLQRRSPEGIPEIVMFEQNPLLNGRLEGSDRFGAWRINADLMSYEELVELSDRIGYVDGGLQEEEILECLKRPKKSIFKSFDFSSKAKDYKCSICQEECKGDEDLGRLECGHYHHLDCIKQWLLRKNECPICKAAAKSDK